MEQNGLSKIKLIEKHVTPKIAAEMLQNNNGNRPMKKSFTEWLAKQMSGGKWQNTSNTIKFDIDGNLIDGQHRLSAVIKSGMSFHFFIASNCQSEVFHVIDTGTSRTGGDTLSVAGYKNANMIAAMVRLIIKIESGGHGEASRAFSPTNTDILEFVQDNPEIINVSEKAKGYYNCMAKVVTTTLIGSFYWVFSKRHNEKVDIFFNCLCCGQDLAMYPIVNILRNRLAKDKIDIAKMTTTYKKAVIIKTWNAYIEEKNVKQLMFDVRREKFPEIL